MNFGKALDALKDGKKVTRIGWGDSFLFLVPGSEFEVNRHPLLGIYPEGTIIPYHAHIDVMTRDGDVMPWVPSQDDILAGDWAIFL